MKVKESLNTLFYIRKSLRYIKVNKWTWKYILIPFILNFLIAAISWILLFNFLQGIILGFGFISIIPGLFTGLISFIVLILTFLATVYIFFLLANIIASPFNSLLTEKMLLKEDIKSPGNPDLLHLVGREIIRSLGFELLKLILIVILFILGLIISVIPIVGVTIAGILNFGGNTYLSLVDYFDPGLSYLGYDIKKRFLHVKRLSRNNWGFFMFSGLSMYIPFFNIIYIPIAVVTANLIIIENNKQ